MNTDNTEARPEVQDPKRAAPNSGRSEMYVDGGPPYAERMAAYLAGDRSQVVSPAFAEAVDAIGNRQVDAHRLTKIEKIALTGRDLRWQPSPEGVLFWAPTIFDATDPQNTADFAWLQQQAQNVFSNLDATAAHVAAEGNKPPCPTWLTEWARSWASWGYRFASLRYHKALQDAKARGAARPLTGAANSINKWIPNIRAFLLEYLPQSGLTEVAHRESGIEDHRWLLPEEFLNTTFHGAADDFRDDFWHRCCSRFELQYEVGTRVQGRNVVGAKRSNDVQSFLDFVVDRLKEGEIKTIQFRNPFLPRNESGILLIPSTGNTRGHDPTQADYRPPISRSADKLCSWISREYPHLRAWEPFAREYMQDVKRDVSSALIGISYFVDRYLANAGKPGTPGELLSPECAKRPIADESGSDALLLLTNKHRVPKTLDLLSGWDKRSALRAIRDGFIPHILNTHCSLIEGDHVELLPQYWNPFANVELDDSPSSTPRETTRDAMPYRWIRRLRNILAEGPHFCDWTWAQQAQQSERGDSADWFEVAEALIDPHDPDCVWRMRTIGSEAGKNERTFYEIWSPVRWVSLLTKLNTALRTMQVRVLDSGESDGWRFDLRQWSAQTYPKTSDAGALAAAIPSGAMKAPPIAIGTGWVVNDVKSRNPALHGSITPQDAVRRKGGKGDPRGWTNGVLRPKWVHDEDAGERQLATLLYINTNKTADSRKEGAAKGFEVALPVHPCPLPPDNAYWVRQGDGKPPVPRTFASTQQKRDWLDELGENSHWWLAKLRDWQEKYNPIDRRIEWRELSGTRLIGEKSDEQYQMYRPVTFLFREPAMTLSKSHPGPGYPLTDAVVANAWWTLLKEFQDRLNAERSEGQPAYKLVNDDTGENRSCVYDLHSIRVSIITALIVEGKVPVQYVQALVGHSRLVMTIYYTKINPLTMMREIATGMSRATEKEVDAEKLFIQNASIEELRSKLAFNDPESALAALGASRSPSLRNAVMWMRKLGGICPVGGVSHDTEGGLSAGCFNGGPLISREGKYSKYAPVEGGPGTCVNCRWFVTKMPFIGELQAIAECALYRYHEFKEKTAHQEDKIKAIKAEFERLETEQGCLTNAQKIQFNLDLEAAEAIRDGFMESAALDVLISSNANHLIQRLVAIQKESGSSEDGALIAKGTQDEIKVILEQTDSAMLHAARICLHSEIHPEINASSATLRAAMTIARKLQEEELDPFALLSLPEDVQTRAVNAVTRHIASMCDPTNLNIGLSRAAALIESRHRLSEITGASPIRLREWVSGLAGGITKMPALESPSGGVPLVD